MGGKIYDVVCMSIHTTCGICAHLYHVVGLSMLDRCCNMYVGAALPPFTKSATYMYVGATCHSCAFSCIERRY